MSNDVVLDEMAEDSGADRALTKSVDVEAQVLVSDRTPLAAFARRRVLFLAVLCVLVDFSLMPVSNWMRRGPPGMVALCFFGLVGCTLAQGNLLAAWLAWSEGPFLRRLVRHWIVAAALYCAWAVGMALAGPPKEVRVAWVIIGLAVPLVSMGAQFPLWITRQWFGWRLTCAESGEPLPREEPLTIRGLLLATLLVAVTVALARLTPFNENGRDSRGVWGFAFFFAAAISAIGMLPAGRILLGIPQFRTALIWSGVYPALLISLVWFVRELLIRYASNGGPPVIGCAILSVLMVGYAATLIVAGSVARALGYRLARGRHPHR